MQSEKIVNFSILSSQAIFLSRSLRRTRNVNWGRDKRKRPQGQFPLQRGLPVALEVHKGAVLNLNPRALFKQQKVDCSSNQTSRSPFSLFQGKQIQQPLNPHILFQTSLTLQSPESIYVQGSISSWLVRNLIEYPFQPSVNHHLSLSASYILPYSQRQNAR